MEYNKCFLSFLSWKTDWKRPVDLLSCWQTAITRPDLVYAWGSVLEYLNRTDRMGMIQFRMVNK